ncbi:type IV pilus assembly protein PilM [Scytonema tolypothrichoides VB-61278]|nr:type IV pilus assembly protein PilM [Scytonema tolypothrichoides VB-61278]
MKLFNSLFGKLHQGVGIELSPQRVNLVQLRKLRQGLKLETLTSVSLPEGVFINGQIVDSPKVAQCIQQALVEGNIKASRVATAIPGRESIIRIISVPAELDDKELRHMVLNHEANLHLPLPCEDADLDYQKLGYFIDDDGIEKIQILLVAIRKEITDTYIKTFELAGLQIDVLDINSFALIRTLREPLRQFGSQEAVVLVDIEFDCTEIAIIVNGIPHFLRTVPIGIDLMQTVLSEAMDLPVSQALELLYEMSLFSTHINGGKTDDPDDIIEINSGMVALMRVLEELADELRRSIDFYLNQNENLEVAQIMLAGPGGGLEQLDDFLTQQLNLPTSQIDPVAALSLQIDEEKYPAVERSGLGIVLGLGMREAD